MDQLLIEDTTETTAFSGINSTEYSDTGGGVGEEYYDPLIDVVYVTWSFTSSCVLLFVCMFGIVSNAITSLIFMHPKIRSPINVLITGHCAIDTAVVVFAVPLLVLHGLNTKLSSVGIEQVVVYSIVLLYPLAMSAKTCSVWASVLITFERYMAVCHPLKTWTFLDTTRKACIAIIGLTILSLSYNLVRFWEYKLDYVDTGQAMPVFVLRSNEVYYRVYYTGVYLVTHFMVPFVTLFLLNTRIIVAIAAAKRQRKNMSRQEIKEHRTAHMMIVVICLFAATNTLPFIMNIIEAVNPKFFSDSSTKLVATVVLDVSNTLVVINSSTTIFVYYYFSTKFRLLFKNRYLKCNRGTVPFSLPGTQYLTTTESMYSLNELVPPTAVAQLVAYFRRLHHMISSSKIETTTTRGSLKVRLVVSASSSPVRSRSFRAAERQSSAPVMTTTMRSDAQQCALARSDELRCEAVRMRDYGSAGYCSPIAGRRELSDLPMPRLCEEETEELVEGFFLETPPLPIMMQNGGPAKFNRKLCHCKSY